jgi:hypothetical protein
MGGILSLKSKSRALHEQPDPAKQITKCLLLAALSLDLRLGSGWSGSTVNATEQSVSKTYSRSKWLSSREDKEGKELREGNAEDADRGHH